MVVAVTAYGMATLEGPLLSLKNVNAIAHFTDWIVAHVHVGGLGWNGFLIFAVLYCSAHVENQSFLHQAGKRTFLVGYSWNYFLRSAYVCVRCCAKPDVERV
jgi:hypothetical protein